MKKEVTIAITACVAVVILFFGLNFLKGLTIFSSDDSYYVRFHDIQGLSAANPIYADGYKVGLALAAQPARGVCDLYSLPNFLSEKLCKMPTNFFPKTLDSPGTLCYTIIRERERGSVSAEAKATEGPKEPPLQKKEGKKNEYSSACSYLPRFY